jgi:hypothetical protein
MPFCNRCGNENSNQSKFCTTCGESLTNTTIPVNAKNSNYKFLYAGIIVVSSILLSFGLYYLTQLKKDPIPPHVSVAQTSIEEDIAEDEIYPILLLPKKTIPTPPVRIEPAPPTTSEQLSKSTIDQIGAVMNMYFEADNSNNVSAALDRFEYPITRYYSSYNVSRDELYDLYNKFTISKNSYHKLTPHFETSSIYSRSDGYDLEIDCNYEWETYKSPGNLKSKYQKLKFKLNNYFKITSVYEI